MKAVELMLDECIWMMWIVQRLISNTYIKTAPIVCSGPDLNALSIWILSPTIWIILRYMYPHQSDLPVMALSSQVILYTKALHKLYPMVLLWFPFFSYCTLNPRHTSFLPFFQARMHASVEASIAPVTANGRWHTKTDMMLYGST